jgi:hypothetical protein
MSKGISRSRRHHRAIDPAEGDEFSLGYLDRADDKQRLHASEKMLAALAREHPGRASTSHPPGTSAPRRLPMPTGVTLKTNFEG